VQRGGDVRAGAGQDDDRDDGQPTGLDDKKHEGGAHRGDGAAQHHRQGGRDRQQRDDQPPHVGQAQRGLHPGAEEHHDRRDGDRAGEQREVEVKAATARAAPGWMAPAPWYANAT